MSTLWQWAKDNPGAAARRIRELECENAALRELIVKKGYIVTYFNDEIGLAPDPWHRPEEGKQ